MFGFAIPIAYLGAAGLSIPAVILPVVGLTVPGVSVPALGIGALYVSFVAETAVPAAINYYRFLSGKWKQISRGYRPDVSAADD